MKNKNGRIIIIDGPDRVGKTTQATLLSETIKIPYVKMPNMAEYLRKGTAEEASKLFNETIIQFSEYDFILDRGFTSSLVYSKVFDRDSDLSYIEMIEQKLQPNVFILVGQPYEDDDIFSQEEIQKVNDEFTNLAKDRGYHLLDVTGKSIDFVNRYIRARL